MCTVKIALVQLQEWEDADPRALRWPDSPFTFSFASAAVAENQFTYFQ